MLRILLALLGLVLAIALWLVLHPVLARRWFVDALSPNYQDAQNNVPFAARFGSADDKLSHIAITLEKIADGFEQPTDLQFPPSADGYAVVLEKSGKAQWLRLADGKHGELLAVDVLTASEEGLLGLAFHPAFAQNGRFFINYVAEINGTDTTRIAEWKLSEKGDLSAASAEPVRVLLEVQQPYPNHNAGQLAFGPDGDLYIGLGDGGLRDDPAGNGQNPNTLLGSMLRIDVDGVGADKPYRIPANNPFVGKAGYLPEIWAYGLRNPWRYSFDTQGRLIVADVGQDQWEELDIVQAGDNLGWSLKEGFACYHATPDACARKDLVDPVFAYGRGQGNSITGGFVYTGTRVPALRGLYVFADFGSGRLFALELPHDRSQRVKEPIALGQWPLMPSTFGRDTLGELYIASFTRGEIYKLAAGTPTH